MPFPDFELNLFSYNLPLPETKVNPLFTEFCKKQRFDAFDRIFP